MIQQGNRGKPMTRLGQRQDMNQNKMHMEGDQNKQNMAVHCSPFTVTHTGRKNQ